MTTVWTGDAMRDGQARRETNETRVLQALRDAGTAGLTNVQLVAVGGMRAVGGRVDALRAKGYDIETQREGRGLFRFVLHEPARQQPGTPGYLASLPALNAEHVQLVELREAAEGRLF